MYEHTYWNSKGPEQAKYNEMEAAGFKYTQATLKEFHSYYRYHNDGDLPGWARKCWELTRYRPAWGHMERVLNEAGEAELERRITERIQIEYARFRRNHKPA